MHRSRYLYYLPIPILYLPPRYQHLGNCFFWNVSLDSTNAEKLMGGYVRITLPLGNLFWLAINVIFLIEPVLLKFPHCLHAEPFSWLIIFSLMAPYVIWCAMYGDMFLYISLFLRIFVFWYGPPFVFCRDWYRRLDSTCPRLGTLHI